MTWRRPTAYAALIVATLAATTFADPGDAGGSAHIVRQGAITLHVSIDKESAQVADPIRLVLELTGPQGTRVELPKLSNHWGDFEVLSFESHGDIPVDANSHEHLWRLTATLETLTTGDVTIPSLEVQYRHDENSATFETIRTKPILVPIASVLEDRADPTRFRDIKDVVDVDVPPDRSRMWLVWTGAGVAIATAMAVGTVLWSRRNRGPTPADWALAQLADLEHLLSQEPADPTPLYHELLDILRQYFAWEYDVPAMTRTSPEFLTEATAAIEGDPIAQQRLASLVEQADAIKFARQRISHPQLQHALVEAKILVRECERDVQTSVGGPA